MKDLKAVRLIESIKDNYFSIDVRQCKDVKFGYYAELITHEGVKLKGLGSTQYKALLNAIQSGFSCIVSDSFLLDLKFGTRAIKKEIDIINILPIHSN